MSDIRKCLNFAKPWEVLVENEFFGDIEASVFIKESQENELSFYTLIMILEVAFLDKLPKRDVSFLYGSESALIQAL